MSNTDQEYDIIPYIPCHFDHSQVEYIMPFLTTYGGKVFIYPSHYAFEKFMKYFESLPNVEAYVFSLENIVKCLSKETKKVAWILTASSAYEWGKYQRQVLHAIEKNCPTKIVDICQIGHCMYGCTSCGGNEHNIPIYFTRYFNKTLPYTALDVKKQYFKENVLNVIVCPSIADTSILVQPKILNVIYELQQTGKINFVWKFHPSSFNAKMYDLNEPLEKQEYEAIQWISKNFTITPEHQSCLLPFFECYDVVLCDLHSSVPFIASYFSPKVIIAYENDANYEKVKREDEYLDLLYRFDQPEQLRTLFSELPKPKGNPSFFAKKYGTVDGKEHLRIAALRKWPLKSKNSQVGVGSVQTSDAQVDFHPTETQLYQSIMADFQSLLKENNNDQDLLDVLGMDVSQAQSLSK